MYLLLQSSLDMDGIVLEIKDLTAIKFPVFYLNILPRNDGSIISLYPILKKHIDITQYKKKSLSLLKMYYGIQLLSSNGWQVNLGLILLANMGSSFDLPCALNHPFFFHSKNFGRVKSILKFSSEKISKRNGKRHS